ncbi:10506_t:CDS:2 [Diversispora eburnea]|uniref:10506_t:CDS:1 n=1 Tax=Diversispora eburnea TaxID=1213867 RepID=A0A9N8YU74_9GLOM|nr:10506_t:CDS:2 [Diversispora eburnea]
MKDTGLLFNGEWYIFTKPFDKKTLARAKSMGIYAPMLLANEAAPPNEKKSEIPLIHVYDDHNNLVQVTNSITEVANYLSIASVRIKEYLDSNKKLAIYGPDQNPRFYYYIVTKTVPSIIAVYNEDENIIVIHNPKEKSMMCDDATRDFNGTRKPNEFATNNQEINNQLEVLPLPESDFLDSIRFFASNHFTYDNVRPNIFGKMNETALLTMASNQFKTSNIGGTLAITQDKSIKNILTPASDQFKTSNIEGTLANTDLNSMAQKASTEDISITEKFDTLHFNIPLETVESLCIYEKKSGEAQKFLDHMGDDFRWPASIHDNIKYQIFQTFVNDDDLLESNQEYALNCIYFYNSLDKGLFNEHKEDWVLVYKQKVVEYGKEYTKQQLLDLNNKMPGAIYLPVDPLLREKIVNPEIPAARIIHSFR